MVKEILAALYSVIALAYGAYLINGVLVTDQIGVQAAALGIGILLLGLPILILDGI